MSRNGKQRKALERLSCAFFYFLLSFSLLACAKSIPEGKDAVDAVHINGVPSKAGEGVGDGLATRASPRFFGIKGVYEYETLSEAALQKDIERLERQMRSRGYYDARVSAARIIHTKERHLRVEFEVIAGEPTIIRKLETVGLAALPFDAAEFAVQKNSLRVGQLFKEEEFEQAKQDVANALSDVGYAYARVTGTAKVDLAAHSAEVTIVANPGVRATLGQIRIEGLEQLDEATVRHILGLRKGDRYSRKELQLARSALFELQVFSRVEIVPNLGDPTQTEVPLTVSLKEGTFRDLRVGLGARLDLIRLALVGQASWTHRNFFGGLRRFNFTTKPGLTFFPTSIDNLRTPTALFPENLASVRLEQPGFIEARTRGYVQAGYNVYPLLYPLPKDAKNSAEKVNPDDERVIGYQEIINAYGAERNFFTNRLKVDLSANFQANVPFNYQGQEEGEEAFPGLKSVFVTYPELVTTLDFRDDPLQPTSGAMLTNNFQVAIPFSPDQVADFRIRPEIRTFIPLDRKHKVVLATRAGVGMVFPQNYGGVTGNYSDPAVVEDQHKFLFRAFYSGGPGSNRGYPYRRIGPQGPIGFLIPSSVSCEPGQVDENGAPAELSPTCIRPLGGLTMWEASAEIRYRAFETWSFVLFADASDVNRNKATFTFLRPHISIGPGIRYISPVGPIRFDLAYRVPGLQNFRLQEDSDPKDVTQVSPYLEQNQRTQDSEGNWSGGRGGVAVNILIGEDF